MCDKRVSLGNAVNYLLVLIEHVMLVLVLVLVIVLVLVRVLILALVLNA